MNILEGASLTSTTPKRRDAGPDVSSRLLRHSRDICLFTVKNLSLDHYFFFVPNLSISYEHRKAWLKTFFAFPSNKIFHRSMRFSFEPNKCHPCLVIHSAFLFLTVIRILTIPRIVCLYDLFFPFFTREMYRFAEEKEKKNWNTVYIIVERNRSL